MVSFADKLEAATLRTIEEGYMTKDLYLVSTLSNKQALNTEEFLRAIAVRLSLS